METKVVELDLNDVLPNRFQPRIKFSEESIAALSESIKEHGVIQPIVVRNIGDKYEIIAGERRYKASILAGKRTIPAIITDLNEKDSAEVALIENVQRKDLTPIEEAISYKKILDMGYLTQDSLAIKLGKTQSTIANKLRLLNLDDDVQEALLNEKISERHARSLLKMTSHEKQRQMLNRIINERLTVRKTDEEIDKMMNNNESIEVLDFGVSTQSTEEKTDTLNNVSQPVVEPFLGTLNIPTEPIVQDSIPEVLPNIQEPFSTTSFNPSPEVINATVPPVDLPNFEIPQQPTDFFKENVSAAPIAQEPIPEVLPNIQEPLSTTPYNPSPEVINATVPPVTLPNFESSQQPINEFNPSSIFSMGNIPTEPSFSPSVEPINNSFNTPIENNPIGVTDIFNEKELAPMDSLLQPSNNYVAPVVEPINVYNNETEEDEGAENILVPGKFFNLMPEENEVQEEPKKDLPMDSFNFDFDINSLNNIESTNNLSSLEDILPIENNQNVNPTEQANAIEPMNTDFFSFNPFENPMDLNKNIDGTHINTNVNNIEETNTDSPSVESIPSQVEDTILTPSIPELNTSVNEPIVAEGTNNTPNLKEAINMVRELSGKLNEMGFTIDIEEFDFENMYQLIFKINK